MFGGDFEFGHGHGHGHGHGQNHLNGTSIAYPKPLIDEALDVLRWHKKNPRILTQGDSYLWKHLHLLRPWLLDIDDETIWDDLVENERYSWDEFLEMMKKLKNVFLNSSLFISKPGDIAESKSLMSIHSTDADSLAIDIPMDPDADNLKHIQNFLKFMLKSSRTVPSLGTIVIHNPIALELMMNISDAFEHSAPFSVAFTCYGRRINTKQINWIVQHAQALDLPMGDRAPFDFDDLVTALTVPGATMTKLRAGDEALYDDLVLLLTKMFHEQRACPLTDICIEQPVTLPPVKWHLFLQSISKYRGNLQNISVEGWVSGKHWMWHLCLLLESPTAKSINFQMYLCDRECPYPTDTQRTEAIAELLAQTPNIHTLQVHSKAIHKTIWKTHVTPIIRRHRLNSSMNTLCGDMILASQSGPHDEIYQSACSRLLATMIPSGGSCHPSVMYHVLHHPSQLIQFAWELDRPRRIAWARHYFGCCLHHLSKAQKDLEEIERIQMRHDLG
uniref:Uncharacterized protein n=1 Tax=Craspedostauros australis TaxID=1486917 RepID=A0A7R9WXN9_9STRA|mmetsp:Transcript_2836/g.7872  ORF Transcript_2836/g.7872 Transcript_2836/m.7872 type:complete len:502 (+) Transcript_2836:1482-2987(+)